MKKNIVLLSHKFTLLSLLTIILGASIVSCESEEYISKTDTLQNEFSVLDSSAALI